MANVIKHKRGSGSDPSASNLVVGELAIRTDTGKLFTKMDSGSIAEIAGGGSDIAINTLSSSSATGGGSATFNGSAYRFTLSSPPSVSAAQLLVSINGVIQKPVAGTGQPSEGFSVDGNDIILGDAPATGSDFFILTFRSLGVSEPADNSVTSAKIVDGAIVNADINASAAIAGTKISSDFGSQNIVTNGRLLLGTTTEGHADADDLTIETSSGYAGITLRSPSDAGGAIYFSDATSGAGEYDGQILYSQSSRTMQLITANNPRLTLDSSGNLLSGTTSSSLLSNFNANAGGLVLDDIGSGATAFLATHGDKQIFLGNDTSANYLWGYSNHDLLFGTNNQTRMTINSSGNIAIGGSSNVGTKLHIENPSGDAHIRLRGSANYGVLFTRHSDGALTGYVGSGAAVNLGGSDIALSATLSGGSIRFQTNGTAATDEKMRIQNDGKIGIGTTAPGEKLTLNGNLLLEGGSTTSYPFIRLHSSAANVRKWTIYNGQPWNPDALLIYDTDEDNTAVTIETNKLGVNKGASSLTRNFEVNGTALITNNLEVSSGQITCGVHGTTGMQIINNGIFGTLHSANLTFRTVSSSKMVIDTNGNVGAPSGSNIYNASDIRLKKNITTLDKGLEAVKSLRPVSFNWIDGFCDDEKETLYGFIAQEVETVDSNLVQEFGNSSVTVEKRTIDSVLRVNEKFIIPMLVKAVQELTAKVEALEAN